MKAIHQYRLEVSDSINTLHLKAGYRVVRFEYLLAEKGLFIWVEEPLRADIPLCPVAFRVALTGKPVAMESQYIATALDPFGPQAYHLFRVDQQSAAAALNGRPQQRCGTPAAV